MKRLISKYVRQLISKNDQRQAFGTSKMPFVFKGPMSINCKLYRDPLSGLADGVKKVADIGLHIFDAVEEGSEISRR